MGGVDKKEGVHGEIDKKGVLTVGVYQKGGVYGS